MKLEDLGFDIKTGHHDHRLTRPESVFVGILWVDHVGDDNKISADDLAERYAFGMGFWLDPKLSSRRIVEHWKREVRYMHNHLLMKHSKIPIMSKAGNGGGYWIAETEGEADEFYRTFRERGMTGLVKASRGKQSAMVEAVEQIAFEFEDMVDRTEGIAKAIPRKKGAMAPEIVDSLLAKMSMEPEKFAGNLRKIREKFFSGAVVLEKERLVEMQEKARDVLTGLTGLTG